MVKGLNKPYSLGVAERGSNLKANP